MGSIKNKALFKYMIFDLSTILIVGFVLELLCVKFGTTVFYGTPFICMSFMMVFIAVVRWNLWGLILIPILVVATIIGGRWSEVPYLAAVYNYKIYISVVIGLLIIGLNVILFKIFGTDKVIVSWVRVVGLILIDYLLFSIIQVLVYRLLTSHNITKTGIEIYEFVKKNGDVKEYNLCKFGEGGFIYDLFGLAVAIVGILVLRSQGVVCNAKQRSIEDRKNAELDRLDRENFTIEEAVNTNDDSGEVSLDKSEDNSSCSNKGENDDSNSI